MKYHLLLFKQYVIYMPTRTVMLYAKHACAKRACEAMNVVVANLPHRGVTCYRQFTYKKSVSDC